MAKKKSAFATLDKECRALVEKVTLKVWEALAAREAGFSIYATSRIIKEPVHFVTSHTTALKVLVTMEQAKQFHLAAEHEGVSISQLCVLSSQERMQRVQDDKRSKPFVGSPSKQDYKAKVQAAIREILSEDIAAQTSLPKKKSKKK